MPFKPMSIKTYLAYIKQVSWKLEKGRIDWNLYDENEDLICSIKISHGRNTKSNEVIAHSVKKTEKEFEKRGFSWPPKKK